MQILFLDESGTPPSPTANSPKYFVLGGLIIPEVHWHPISKDLSELKNRWKISGEIKWRYFSPHNTDSENPMLGMTQADKNKIRIEIYTLITSRKSVKIIGAVCCASAAYKIKSLANCNDLYHFTYKPVTERFQYYLQDLTRTIGRDEFGIIVCDHRGPQDDKRLRELHQNLLYSSGTFTSNYVNLIEGLFIAPSDQSVGIQLADMVAGALWRFFERGDDQYYKMIESHIRRGPNGQIYGYGIVKVPKDGWI